MHLQRRFARVRSGFLLIEALLGIALLSLFLAATGIVLLQGQESTVMGGDRARALFLSERAVEAARIIRDEDFASVTAGQHGIALDPTGKWVFQGTKTAASGGYMTTLTVTSLASDWVRVVAQTKWKHGVSRSGSVSLETELTDWRLKKDIGNWAANTLEGSYVDNGTPLFNDIAVSGNYAFITSETSAGGKGLYVFDISNLAVPVRVASSFSLEAAGYEVLVKGSTLYVLVGDTNAEVRAYDISSPTTLSSSNLRTSYNLPGQGLGISLALDEDTLYVGATESAVSQRDELYAFNVSNPSQIVFKDSLDDTSTNSDIALSGTAAYLASSYDVSELRLVDAENPANLQLAAGQGYNVTSTQDGSAVAVAGTSAILGRLEGSSIDELVLFDVQKSPLPLPPPGPWYRDIGGSVNGLDTDILGCYAFIASDFSNKELQIVSLKDHSLPEASYYNTTTGAGRGLLYDETRDRVYLLTNKAFLILKPTTTSGICA